MSSDNKMVGFGLILIFLCGFCSSQVIEDKTVLASVNGTLTAAAPITLYATPKPTEPSYYPTAIPTTLPSTNTPVAIRADLIGASLNQVQSKLEKKGYIFGDLEIKNKDGLYYTDLVPGVFDIKNGNGVIYGYHPSSDAVNISLMQKQYNLVEVEYFLDVDRVDDEYEAENLPDRRALIDAVFSPQTIKDVIEPWYNDRDMGNPADIEKFLSPYILCFDGYLIVDQPPPYQLKIMLRQNYIMQGNETMAGCD